LARDPRFVGGQIGMVGVLHTWGRTLTFHPHVHYLIPAGGLAADGQTWLPAREDFLLPVKALSPIFRAKFRDALRDTECFTAIPASVWDHDWVVHCQPVGNGLKAFKYLAPYIFRVAISNSRLVSCENDQVTFRYRDSNTGQPKLLTLEVVEFIHRFLQHVLPPGFVKVRYYGLLSPGCREALAHVRQQLTPTDPNTEAAMPASSDIEPLTTTHASTPEPTSDTTSPAPLPLTEAADPLPADPALLTELDDDSDSPDEPATPTSASATPRCPTCGRPMRRRGNLPPKGRAPP
jgi:hypothetical protein